MGDWYYILDDTLTCQHCNETVVARHDTSYGPSIGCACRAFNIKFHDKENVKEHYRPPGGISWEHDPEERQPYWQVEYEKLDFTINKGEQA